VTTTPRYLAIAATLAWTSAAGAQASVHFRAFADSAEQARVKGDWVNYGRLTDSVYAGIGNYPNILWAQARAAARTGNRARAVERMRAYASTGLWRDITADSAFTSMLGDPDMQPIRARLDANRNAPVRAGIAYTIPDSNFVPESIVYEESSDRFYLSSIGHGEIVTWRPGAEMDRMTRSADGGVWSGFGLALDPRRRTLWLTSQQIPHYTGYTRADSGRTGVAAFDLGRGTWVRRLLAPDDEVGRSFGDAAVMGDGTIIVADAQSGMMFAASPGDTALRVLVASGVLASPQGIAPADDPRFFYVADYLKGIARVERATGRAEVLPHHDSIAVAGIDGMIRVGGSLIGVQNGFVPRRVIRYDLDPSGRRIVGQQVLESNRDFLGETTHLTYAKGKIYFMARTGFDLFGPDGKLRAGVTLPKAIVGVVDLK
jgi:hypothetical protein